MNIGLEPPRGYLELTLRLYLSFTRLKNPGGGLGIPTDRDKRSWIFLNEQKNTLSLTEDPKKIPCEKPSP